MESLFGSVVIHLLALLVVLVFAADRHGPRHDVVRVDLSKFSPARESTPRPPSPATDSKAEPAPHPSPEAPSTGQEIPIPRESAPVAENTPPPPPPASVAESPPEAWGELPPISQAVPSQEPVPDPDVYQAFMQDVYRRLDQVTVRSWGVARAMAQMGMSGGEYHFHVLISPDGWSVNASFVPDASSILVNNQMDAGALNQHIGKLLDLVLEDIRAGVPYPPTPPNVPLKPFCYGVKAPFAGGKL